MIALDFIPSTSGALRPRRIDLARLAGQFGEREEGMARRRPRAGWMRIAVLALVLLGAIGDTMLISHREALASCLAATQAAPARATTF